MENVQELGYPGVGVKDKKEPVKRRYEYVDANIQLSFKQRINYAVADYGYNAIYFWVSAYLMIYYTDVIGLSAAAISILVLAIRIFDAINDPFIGSLADRTKTRWGRFRPWIFGGGIALALSVILLFSANSGWSYGTKLFYVWFVYILVTLASTSCNMPFGALNGCLTSNAKERIKLSGMRMVFANIGLNIAGVVAMPLVIFFSFANGGINRNGYFWAVLLICLTGIPSLIWTAANTKEVLNPPPTQDKIALSDQFKTLFKNPYIMIIVLGMFVQGIIMYGRMTSLTYYFQYVSHQAALMSVYSIVNMAGAIFGAGFVASWSYGVLKNKGRVQALWQFISAISFAVMFFTVAPNPVFWVLSFICSIGAGVGGATAYGMIPDAIDYGEIKTGVRCDGFLASFTSTALKFGGAIGPAAIGAWLAFVHYIPGQEQSAQVIRGINMTVTLLPAVFSVLMGALYMAYNLDEKRHEEIRIELDNRRK